MSERGTEPSVNGAILQRPHQGRMRKRRSNRVEAIQQRAMTEVGIIVHLYLEGLSFRKIATRLGRDRWYIANVFYSPMGQQLVAAQKAKREILTEDLHERIVLAAQSALDEIIALAASADSEAIRLKASECIVEKALQESKLDGTNLQVNVSDDALRLALNTLEEIIAPEKPSDDTDAAP